MYPQVKKEEEEVQENSRRIGRHGSCGLRLLKMNHLPERHSAGKCKSQNNESQKRKIHRHSFRTKRTRLSKWLLTFYGLLTVANFDWKRREYQAQYRPCR